jgi:hypothetical protein
MEEVEYIRNGKTLVTSTRIEIDGQTFAVRNVGSVKVVKPRAPLISGIIAAALVLAGLTNFAAMWFALLLGAGLAAYAFQQARTRSLVLVSGGGEVVALRSTNGGTVEKLRDAIAKAIAGR